MSDGQLIQHIHSDKECDRLWKSMTLDQRRRTLLLAEGDTWLLADLMRDVIDAEDEAV
ncbi:MAG: hypothetical protein KF855_03625 [Acidobacteria bacterium]|nr:hypothetical protein [Acidobacteriota bacterium]